MRLAMITFATVFASNLLAGLPDANAQRLSFEGSVTQAPADTGAVAPLSPEAINTASLSSIAPEQTVGTQLPDPAMVRLQVLLDRSGASPGVIDGFDGDNVRKAVRALREMQGLPISETVDADLLAVVENDDPVIGHYTITDEDAEAIVEPISDDYAEQARRDFLGYESVAELIAERFHMHVDLLEALNAGAAYVPGERLFVTAHGPGRTGDVVRIEADKRLRQVRAYDADGGLVAAYPATIGSQDNPSPSGTHQVETIVPMPNYTYNPEINFQQGENTEVLVLPPGPNNPVGTIWIGLSQPTYGIHGTPKPHLIDKVASHGCVRLTNWDAEELAAMVSVDTIVTFLD
jgi:lipoprotein-anchoring transpeptidase ErfK/SrfK